jgi:hypothetical protein
MVASSVPPDRPGTRPNQDGLEWPISITDFIGLAVRLGLVRNRNGPNSDSPLLFDAQNGSPLKVRIEIPSRRSSPAGGARGNKKAARGGCVVARSDGVAARHTIDGHLRDADRLLLAGSPPPSLLLSVFCSLSMPPTHWVPLPIQRRRCRRGAGSFLVSFACIGVFLDMSNLY